VVPEALGGGHRDLTVRVATYSSLFVELSKELQDDIVARIEFE
jgi:pyruvate-formate lyase